MLCSNRKLIQISKCLAPSRMAVNTVERMAIHPILFLSAFLELEDIFGYGEEGKHERSENLKGRMTKGRQKLNMDKCFMIIPTVEILEK